MMYYTNMSLRRFLSILVLLVAVCVPARVLAAELSVTPIVIDDKAKARDILKRSITIQNTSNRKLQLYPSVNDVAPADGAQPFVSAQNADQRADSLANWVELSRGVVEMSPGEEKTIPFVVRVAPNAVPGMYHAWIRFGDGSDRAQAEARTPLATVTINIDVGEDVKEFLQLNKFTTDRLFFSGDDVLFRYSLENIGNQELKPKGEIRIYDRKGEEVASVEVNAEGKGFSPDQQLQLASVWSGARGFGKYKAFLSVDYGSSQVASVQDTVYFWIVPWQQLLALLVAGLIAVVALALYYHRWLEEQHRIKYGIPVAAAMQPEAVVAATTQPNKQSIFVRAFNVIPSVFTYLAALTPRPNHRKISEMASAIPAAPQESSAVAVKPVRGMAHEQTLQPTTEAYGQVIDLKKIRSPQPVEHHSLEVIDLKKRS